MTNRLERPSAPLDERVPRIASRWPVYDEDERTAVDAILRSGRVNALHHGDACRRFEAGFMELCAMPHAIALANGTVALEVALRALGLGPGDEVIVPARSFVASASCVVACGAIPVFADVDPHTQGLSVETVAQQLTEQTRAIIVVHLGGHPAAVREIAAFARAHDVLLIEDCAQAHGATIAGRAVGSFGDAAAFSFCTDKIMSTGGEGGMLLLRDEPVARRAWSLKDHGKDRAVTTAPASTLGFRWLHRHFGSNYRLTEMQAAIGIAQLNKLPGWINTRRRNAETIRTKLEGATALRMVTPPEDVRHAYYKFYVFVRPELLQRGWSRDRIVEEANAEGIPCQTGICPEIYLERAFVDRGFGPAERLPVARELGRTSLMLPVDPTLDAAMCRTMGRVLREVIDEASR